ncbi:MAG: alpha/beta hydrolase family protein [Limisphaerales bacterium]
MRSFVALILIAVSASAANKVTPPAVVKHLQRVYDPALRQFGFRSDYPGGIEQWQKHWRPQLRSLLGLQRIEKLNRGFTPKVNLGKTTDHGSYTRQRASIETEPNVRIPFWLLRPKSKGPFPLAVLPHGHDGIGHDTYAGVWHNDKHENATVAKNRDVAVQAVKQGFLAIAPAVRGLSVNGVPDIYARHDKRNCRSHLMHCLLAGRTAIGERVWDMEKLIDWALTRNDVDARNVLMMGNSGGGFVTMYAAALDPRVTIAVPSCSFDKLVAADGRIYQCDCNTVPGILAFGGMSDVVGLIAPRHLLIVSGHGDKLHNDADIEAESKEVARIFKATSVPNHFDHLWGNDGHRFYQDLMWPFVTRALKE